MNEWKELEIDNLPSDMVTGNYEWEMVEYSNTSKLWEHTKIIGLNICDILENKLNDNREYRYRKPEPKAPSHEEIMTKWWKYFDIIDNRNKWEKVGQYSQGCYCLKYDEEYDEVWETGQDFIGRESADLPPEA